MRIVIFLIVCCLAMPATAQQERECRGKQGFKLSDGTYGCLFEATSGSITTTTSRDDGYSSSKRNRTGFMRVLVFGPYSSKRSVIISRMKQICPIFQADVEKAMAGRKYHRTIVQMIWPRVKNPEGIEPPQAVQAGFSTSTCRGARLFDR